ncbi:Acid stress protein IbaG [Buchnera aphidicola (Eriosoma grossulariae)]|uniref:BolA family protein n=1 Tax=Buchnera aphidicola TaxID=9 RepID=UPI003464A168
MDIQKIKSILMKSISSLENVYIKGDNNHIEIIAIGKIFLGMKHVKQQQTIYIPLMQYFTNQIIHSVSIKTFTPQEWNQEKNNHTL